MNEARPTVKPGPDQVGDFDFLAGGGEMGALMRAHDWAKTPLGAVETWPQSLRTSVSTCLNCAFPILIWWGPELVMLYNDDYRLIVGDKHPQSMGQKGKECWPEIWDVIGPMLRGVMEAGEATRAEDLLLLLERSGYPEECYFSFSYSPIRDESGGIGGVFTPVKETTEKVIGERRLRTLRDLAVRGMQAQGADAACHVAAQTLAANPHDIPFALLYRIEQDGARARLVGAAGMETGTAASPPVVELDGADDAEQWPLSAVARSGRAAVVNGLEERFGSLPCGAWLDAPHTAVVLPVVLPGQERPAALLVAATSPRKRLDEAYHSFNSLVAGQVAAVMADALAYEEERKRAEALAEIDRAKTLFFSNISHEFRTPLTLILGPLEHCLSEAGLPEEERERITVAYRNSLRLLKLVNALLDFSRIEAGRAQAVYRSTDLARLTTDLASNFRSLIERAGMELIVDCPPLPECVFVDRDMWEKIVLNLLSNAFKFTFEGEIAVRLRAVHSRAEFSVRDTGAGVPPQELPRLFERFHRVEGQRSRTHEGSGIGLALVQELVSLHGGTIRAESEVGRGTGFIVSIPFGTAHLLPERVGAEQNLASTSVRAEAYVEEALRWLPDAAALSGAVPNRGEAPDELSPLRESARVLLADDNADMRAYVSRQLGVHWQVEAVADGQAALDAIRERRPDLVLTDVMMPRLDGFGLLRAIRSDPGLRDLPVIMLSARAGEEARIEGLDAGADDYLTKPFSARELLAHVRTNLAMAALRRQNENRLKLLINELNHRVKNTLATVQAIVAQVLRDTSVGAELREAIESRLIALSRSHNLLTRENWETASLRDVVNQALEPFGMGDGKPDRIAIAGEEVRLRPKQALALGMAFHELATNAAKYGAISNRTGGVRITWKARDGRLRLLWKERDGPAVKPPSRKGFGSRLIERGLAHELDGEVRLDYAPEGVVCEIGMPLSAEGEP